MNLGKKVFQPDTTANAKVLKVDALGMFMSSKAVRAAECWEVHRPQTA